MPFAGYKDFKDCVSKARRKGIRNPEAYCGSIENRAKRKKRKTRSTHRRKRK